MDPERLSRLLAEFRSVVTNVIFEHGGTVDKFIGDAVLAVFGALQPAADDAARAIRCGAKVLAAVDAWSAAQTDQRQPRISVGIGAHYGEVFVGAVGDERMLEFTVLGDAVNLAERLERLTRTAGGAFMISRDILEAAGPARSWATWAPVSQSLIAGRLKGVEVFSLQACAGMPSAAQQ
jgi:adenylate cyclase